MRQGGRPRAKCGGGNWGAVSRGGMGRWMCLHLGAGNLTHWGGIAHANCRIVEEKRGLKGAWRGGVGRIPSSCLGEEHLERCCTKKHKGGLQKSRRVEKRGSLLHRHLNRSIHLNARTKGHDQWANGRGGDGRNGGGERHKVASGEQRSR